MKRIITVVGALLIGLSVLSISGCAVDSVYPRPYVAPNYSMPSPAWSWRMHPREGWGWSHPDRGWHRGWR